jgi:type II secretory pathway pseudopilin PulG
MNNKGFSVVELVIVSAIIIVAFGGILGVAAFSTVAAGVARQTTEATLLAQEEMESLGNWRDGTDWSVDGLGVLTIGADYYSAQSAGAWDMNVGTESVGEFTRKFVLADVCRDGSDDIAGCPATYTDADTVEATVTVSWTERSRSHQVEIVKYFTNW